MTHVNRWANFYPTIQKKKNKGQKRKLWRAAKQQGQSPTARSSNQPAPDAKEEGESEADARDAVIIDVVDSDEEWQPFPSDWPSPMQRGRASTCRRRLGGLLV